MKIELFTRYIQLTLAASALLSACSTPSGGVNISGSVQTTQTIETVMPVTTANSENLDSKCLRPYTDDSLWNVPIDWDAAKLHPDTDQMMSAFFKNSTWIGADTSQYSPNIYFVDNATPLISVELQEGRRFRSVIEDLTIEYGESGGTVLVPIPSHAQPAPGTDGELALVNLETGEEWGLIKGRILDAEHWLVGGLYKYSVYASGIPPKGFAQRGAGVGSFAGIVRPCEVERGYIGHAVTIAYDYPCMAEVCAANGWPASIPPFTKTDGDGTAQFDIPEGARLAIKPEITEDEIIQACSGLRGCVAWALAMQKYGGFIVDNSGHPKTYGEGNATAHWPAALWSEDMLRDIPPSWYVVIDWNYPATSSAAE
ncbi:MAG: hypothetical protein IT310_13000 [Anaerolineales bacterium]|nr:hypothetical protein [Anaerolineales bacterium]